MEAQEHLNCEEIEDDICDFETELMTKETYMSQAVNLIYKQEDSGVQSSEESEKEQSITSSRSSLRKKPL